MPSASMHVRSILASLMLMKVMMMMMMMMEGAHLMTKHSLAYDSYHFHTHQSLSTKPCCLLQPFADIFPSVCASLGSASLDCER